MAKSKEITQKELEISDGIFVATGKIELMQTLLSVLLNMVEGYGEISSEHEACMFATQQGTIDDLLHIAIDGIFEVHKILENTQDIVMDKKLKSA